MWCRTSHVNQTFLYDAFFNRDAFLTCCSWSQAKAVQSGNILHIWKKDALYHAGINIWTKFRGLCLALIRTTVRLPAFIRSPFFLFLYLQRQNFIQVSNYWQESWFPSLAGIHLTSLSQRCASCPRANKLVLPGCYSYSTGFLQLASCLWKCFTARDMWGEKKENNKKIREKRIWNLPSQHLPTKQASYRKRIWTSQPSCRSRSTRLSQEEGESILGTERSSQGAYATTALCQTDKSLEVWKKITAATTAERVRRQSQEADCHISQEMRQK